VAFVFLVVAGMLLGSLCVTYWAGLRTVESTRKMAALRSVIDRLDQFLSTVKDAETGQRGYVLAGKEPYLKPYHEAVSTIRGELDSLADMASRGDLPEAKVSRVRVLTGRKLAEMETTIKDYREKGLGAALGTVFSDNGRLLMEEIRALLGDMRTEQKANLDQAARAADRAATIRNAVFLLTTLPNMAFLAWAYRRIVREILRCNAAVTETDRQKQLLATTLSSIGDGVIVTDTEARVTFLNRAAASLTGWSSEQALGSPIADVFKIVDEQTRASVENPVAHVLRAGAVAGLTNHTLLVRKDGGVLPIDDSGAPICQPGGRLLGVVLVFRDITERHRAEEALRESEERLRNLFHQAAVGIKRLDTEGHLLQVNEKLCQILGYSSDELLRLSVADITHRDDLPQERAELARLMAREIPQYVIEKRCIRKDGDVIWVRVTNSLPAAGDRPDKWCISIVEEITARKQADETLRQTTAELARSNQDLEQFAYVASHDLQEPLRMVAGYLQLLSERYRGKLDEKADKFIAYAVDGAERMAGLIRDLLAYSRVNSRGEQFRKTSAEEALQIALRNLAASIEESGAAVHSGPLPVVRADKTQLSQLFQNLVGNAVKFRSPDRTAEIQVSAEQNAGCWLFTVRDNGIGFDEKYQDKMFLIFQRLQGRGKYPGTGIGLAICKRIVERHGGRIWATSRPGHGSTFHFTIPLEGSA